MLQVQKTRSPEPLAPQRAVEQSPPRPPPNLQPTALPKQRGYLTAPSSSVALPLRKMQPARQQFSLAGPLPRSRSNSTLRFAPRTLLKGSGTPLETASSPAPSSLRSQGKGQLGSSCVFRSPHLLSTCSRAKTTISGVDILRSPLTHRRRQGDLPFAAVHKGVLQQHGIAVTISAPPAAHCQEFQETRPSWFRLKGGG